MSEPQATLDAYRRGLTDTVREANEQLALGVDPDWNDAAWGTLIRLARSGREFSADDLVDAAGSPSSPGATGALFAHAARQGLIRMAGVTTSRRLTRHGSLQRVWRGRLDA